MAARAKTRATAPRRRRTADIVGRVHQAIQAKAIDCEFRPGEHVNELALARELKVSRTPIREALNRLVSEGLMTLVPNKGFYARPIDIDVTRGLFEARSGIEAMAVRLAVTRASDQAIDALTAHWSEIKARSRTLGIAEIARLDEAFHERLVALSGNPELSRILKDINARIRFVRVIAMETPHNRRITFSEHHEILAALRRRDAAACAVCVERHISITLDDIERITKEGIARIYLRAPSPV